MSTRATPAAPVRRGLAVVLLAALALVALIVSPLASAAAQPAASATATPSPGADPSATATSAEPAVTLLLTDLSPTVATPEDTLTFTGTLTNATDVAFENPVVTIGVQQAVPLTRDTLMAWFATSGAPSARVEYRAPLELTVPPGTSQPFTLSVPMSEIDFPIRFDNWGARGLELALTTRDARTVVRTVGTFYPTEGVSTPLVRIAALLPATPTAQEWRESAFRPGQVGTAAGQRVRALTSVAGASIALDPTVAGASAARSVIALPWADADLGVLPLAGDDGAQLLTSARDRSTRAFATVPVAATFGIAWPASPGVTGDLVTALAEAGYGGVILETPPVETVRTSTPDARVDLVPSSDGSGGEGDNGDGGRGTSAEATVDPAAGAGATLPALVADPAFSEVVAGQAPHVDVDPALAARQLTVAISAVVARESSDPAAMLAVLDRADAGAMTPEQSAAYSTRLVALAAAPWVDLVTVETLLADTADTTVPVADLSQEDAMTPDRRRVLEAAVADRDLAADLESAFEDDTVLLAAAETLTIAPSTAWRIAGTTGAEVTDEVHAELETLTSGVTASPPESQVNLFAEESAVPLVLTNSLDVPVTVHLTLDPEHPALRVDDTPDLTLAAGSSQTVRVPVTAIANGQTSVRVHVTSPDGAPLGPSATFSMVVRAEWETVTSGVIAAALAVLLVLGLVRTIRRGRRGRDGVAPEPRPAAGPRVAGGGS